MWLFVALVFTLCNVQIRAESEAQVLITNRGEPAPFPHFPTLNAEPAVPPVVVEQPAFVFAPTPLARAPPPAVTTPNPPFLLATPAVPDLEDPEPLPEAPQAIGKLTLEILKS